MHDQPDAPAGASHVVVLSGHLDASGRETVREALATALAADGTGDRREIVVDVTAVRSIDAGTVRLLLQAQQAARDTGRHLRVSGPHDTIHRIVTSLPAGLRLLTGIHPAAADAADRARAAIQFRHADADRTRIVALLEQQAIDSEIRATRRMLLDDLRQRLRTEPGALRDDRFLAVADAPAALTAIIVAATIVGAASACDLQLRDPDTGALHLTRHHGLDERFLTYFATVSPGQATACALAAATGEPVVVDDVTRSPIFAGQPTLEVMTAAGSRAVASYPLHDDAGTLLGVLSLHYRTTVPRHGRPDLVARYAARALAGMPGPSTGTPRAEPEPDPDADPAAERET